MGILGAGDTHPHPDPPLEGEGEFLQRKIIANTPLSGAADKSSGVADKLSAQVISFQSRMISCRSRVLTNWAGSRAEGQARRSGKEKTEEYQEGELAAGDYPAVSDHGLQIVGFGKA